MKKIMMNRFFALLLIAAAAAPVLTGCSYFEARDNRANLEKVRVGMTRDAVLEIMGEPLKDEVYHRDNVWFYFTSNKWFDGMNTRDECTPLVFDSDGVLLGFGYDFFKAHFDGGTEFDRSVLDTQL